MALILKKTSDKVKTCGDIRPSLRKGVDITLLDFTEVFKSVVTETMFTIYKERKLGDIIVHSNEVIYNVNKEELYLLYRLMEGDILTPTIGNKIISFLTEIWDKNEDFQILSYEYYLSKDLKKLEKTLKVFRYYSNPVEITSVWSYYRFKLNEMYKPIRNCLVGYYRRPVYPTQNPLYFMLEGNLNPVEIVFNDRKYKADKKGEHYPVPLY